MRKLKVVIKPLVTEKLYCHDRDISILVAVKNFVGKKCRLITLREKAKVRLWRRIKIFIEFLWLFVLSGVFASHDSDALNKIAMFSNKKTQKKTKLVDWQFERTEWIKRFGERRTWRWCWVEIESKNQSMAFQKQKPCKKNGNGRSLRFSVL